MTTGPKYHEWALRLAYTEQLLNI